MFSKKLLQVSLLLCAITLSVSTVVGNVITFGSIPSPRSSPFNGRVLGGINFVQDGIYVEAFGISSSTDNLFGSSFHTAESDFLFHSSSLSDRGIILEMNDGTPFDLVSLDFRASQLARFHLHTNASKGFCSYACNGWDGVSQFPSGPWTTVDLEGSFSGRFENITRLYIGLDDLTGLDNIVLNPVPEPVSMMMLGIAILPFIRRR